MIELLMALILLSWVMLIFTGVTRISFDMTDRGLDDSVITQDYIAKNTGLYRDFRESVKFNVNVEANRIETDKGIYRLVNNRLYRDTEEIYKLRFSSLTYSGGVLTLHMEIDNHFNQEVDIVVRREFGG
jgi:hypothetical protein